MKDDDISALIKRLRNRAETKWYVAGDVETPKQKLKLEIESKILVEVANEIEAALTKSAQAT